MSISSPQSFDPSTSFRSFPSKCSRQRHRVRLIFFQQGRFQWVGFQRRNQGTGATFPPKIHLNPSCPDSLPTPIIPCCRNGVLESSTRLCSDEPRSPERATASCRRPPPVLPSPNQSHHRRSRRRKPPYTDSPHQHLPPRLTQQQHVLLISPRASGHTIPASPTTPPARRRAPTVLNASPIRRPAIRRPPATPLAPPQRPPPPRPPYQEPPFHADRAAALAALPARPPAHAEACTCRILSPPPPPGSSVFYDDAA